MDTTALIAIGLAIVVAWMIFKFLAKTVLKIVGILFISAVLIAYLYYADFIQFDDNRKIELTEKASQKLNLDFSVEKLKTTYCSGQMSHEDSIRCECIITPLYDYITKNYTEEELEALKKNKFKALIEIKKILGANKEKIKEKLRERDAEDLWDKFVKELTSGDLRKEL